ncbi:PAS domain S-box protein [Chloroflexota bacterium]
MSTMKTILPQKRTLARKLWLGFGLLIALLALISIVAYWQIQRVDNNVSSLVEVQEPIEQIVLNMRIVSGDGMQALSDYARDRDSDYSDIYVAAKEDLNILISEFNDLAPNDDIEQLGQSISDKYQSWILLGDNLRVLIHDESNDLIGSAFTEFEDSSGDLNNYLTETVLSNIKNITSEAAAKAGDAISTADKLVLALGITGFVVGILIAWIISRRMSKPVAELINGAHIVSSGKTEHRFDIEPRNELGELGSALNKMLTNLSRSKEALGESEETAWALLDSTTDSVILTDLRGIILASNELAAERFDKSLEQLIDASVYDLLSMDVALSFKTRVEEVNRTRKPVAFQEEDQGRILDTTMYPVFNSRGQITRVAIFARDITIRKWVDEVTDKMVRRNELILESAGEGIYGIDTQGKTIFVNPAAARMLGYKPEDLIGQRHHELVHHSRPDGKPYPSDKCLIQAAFKTGKVHTSVDNEVFWRKDGTFFPVEYTSTPIMEDGQIAGAVVTFRDISERKRFEDVLRKSEEKYRSMFESTASLVVSVNQDANVIDCNSRITQMLGYTPEEVIGQKLTAFMDSDYRTIAQESLDRVLVKGFEYDKQYKMVRKDNTVIDVNMNAAAVRDAKGEYVRTICMVSNVSQQ